MSGQSLQAVQRVERQDLAVCSTTITRVAISSTSSGTGLVSTIVAFLARECGAEQIRFKVRMPEGSSPPENGSSSSRTGASVTSAEQSATFFFCPAEYVRIGLSALSVRSNRVEKLDRRARSAAPPRRRRAGRQPEGTRARSD